MAILGIQVDIVCDNVAHLGSPAELARFHPLDYVTLLKASKPTASPLMLRFYNKIITNVSTA